MIYKHKIKEYEVHAIEINYIDIADNYEVSDRLQYIYFMDSRGKVCKMPRICFHNEFEQI